MAEQSPSLPSLVRRRRLELRLTQREAAEQAEVSLATWQSVERGGDAQYQDLTLSRIAHALGLELEAVFDAAGQELPARIEGGTEPTPEDPSPVAERDASRSEPSPEPDHLLDECISRLRGLAERSEEDFLFVADHILELVGRLERDRG